MAEEGNFGFLPNFDEKAGFDQVGGMASVEDSSNMVILDDGANKFE
jgi:hypothetical protein